MEMQHESAAALLRQARVHRSFRRASRNVPPCTATLFAQSPLLHSRQFLMILRSIALRQGVLLLLTLSVP